MKRIVKLIAITAMLSMMTGVTALADTAETAATAGLGAIGSIYELHLINGMAGRAGSFTVDAGKGIAFEALEKDILNVRDFLKAGVRTDFSASSIDPSYDLITTANGAFQQGIQCKSGDSASQIYKIINQCKDGHYSEETVLVGTKECAKAFNEKAVGTGLEMVDSGISDETVKELAQLNLGTPMKAAEVIKNIGRSTVIYAVVDMTACGIEALASGYTAEETVAHMATGGGKGAIKGCLSSVAYAAAKKAILVVATGTAASKVVPFVVAVGTTMIVGYALDNIVEEANLEALIADAVKKAGAKIVEFGGNVKTKATEVAEDLGTKVETVAGSAKESVREITESAKESLATVKDTANEKAKQVKEKGMETLEKVRGTEKEKVLLEAAAY